jgi:hypothetical protein
MCDVGGKLLEGVKIRENLEVISDGFKRIFLKMMKRENVSFAVHCPEERKRDMKMRVDMINRALKSTYRGKNRDDPIRFRLCH